MPINEARLDQETNGSAGPPKFEDMEPPAYDIAVKLPTYEEAQHDKMAAEEGRCFTGPLPTERLENREHRAFDIHPAHFDANTTDLALGTDICFFTAFLVAFLFNWIGFLLLMCVCHTVAGRYGALAGFGLSLAKWTYILEHNTQLGSINGNYWLWWLLMAFGILICVRAVIQYLCIKREWHRLSRPSQERVVFFY